jgi:hypothetical protein
MMVKVRTPGTSGIAHGRASADRTNERPRKPQFMSSATATPKPSQMITMESVNSSVVRTEPQKNAPCSIWSKFARPTYLREGTALVGLTFDDHPLTPTDTEEMA